MSSDEFLNTKIVIAGTPSVGKTSLRRKFMGEAFNTNYIPTVGADFSYLEKHEEQSDLLLGLSLWDLAGQQKFKSVHPKYYKASLGAIIVYSVVNRDSFEQVPQWIEEFTTHVGYNQVPIMIIGNKIDLLDNNDNDNNDYDIITQDEHEALIERMQSKFDDYIFHSIRTSALTGKNVSEGLDLIAKGIGEWYLEYYDIKEKMTFKDDIDYNIPATIVIGMNEVSGPVIIASAPKIDDKLRIEIQANAVSLVSSLDFDDIINESTIINNIHWKVPRGRFHYIAFVIDNPNARGNKELYILGLIYRTDIDSLVQGLKGILNGFLHNSMNEFVRFRKEELPNNILVEPYNHKDYASTVEDLSVKLNNFRKKFFESIKKWNE